MTDDKKRDVASHKWWDDRVLELAQIVARMRLITPKTETERGAEVIELTGPNDGDRPPHEPQF